MPPMLHQGILGCVFWGFTVAFALMSILLAISLVRFPLKPAAEYPQESPLHKPLVRSLEQARTIVMLAVSIVMTGFLFVLAVSGAGGDDDEVVRIEREVTSLDDGRRAATEMAASACEDGADSVEVTLWIELSRPMVPVGDLTLDSMRQAQTWVIDC